MGNLFNNGPTFFKLTVTVSSYISYSFVSRNRMLCLLIKRETSLFTNF